MTAVPPGFARLLLLPGSTEPLPLASVEGVVSLIERYAPSMLYAAPSAAAQETARALTAASGMTGLIDDLLAQDFMRAVDRIAGAAHAQTVLLIADRSAVSELVCRALGIPAQAGAAFAVEPGTLSVLEVDPDGRWAVVRLNEGRPLPGEP